MFVTWREPIKNSLAFPTRTEADDVLHFESRDVHYRIKVRYYDYKVFASKVSVKEVDDETTPTLDENTPDTNRPLVEMQSSPKIGTAQDVSLPPVMRRAKDRLTIKRDEAFKNKHHHAAFNLMKVDEGELLVAAWIDLDVCITDPNALTADAAHELRHGLGLSAQAPQPLGQRDSAKWWVK
jgi:hypothetical protein